MLFCLVSQVGLCILKKKKMVTLGNQTISCGDILSRWWYQSSHTDNPKELKVEQSGLLRKRE